MVKEYIFMQKIYLDYSATTPVDERVQEAMQPYFSDIFGNPSSIHSFGQEAVRGVDWAKGQLAALFGCAHKEIILTSGATESNNLAIRGVVKRFQEHNPKKTYHIITSTIEHPSVLEVCKQLEKEGIEVTYVTASQEGTVSVDAVIDAVKENTILVSIMYVNNEVGTIQPIRDIGKAVEKINKQRAKSKEHSAEYGESKKLGIFEKLYFHTDAVQAAFYEKMNAAYLHVDLISISAHKIYGPKGVGALYIHDGTPISGISFGGSQEYNLRPGTYNTAGIVGMGKAVELIHSESEHAEDVERIRQLRDLLESQLKEKLPNMVINGDTNSRAPGHLHISLPGIEGESMLLLCDLEGIAVSTGSACSSGAVEPSHVLVAMGFPKERYRGSLRITIGKYTTQEEIAFFVEQFTRITEKLQKK